MDIFLVIPASKEGYGVYVNNNMLVIVLYRSALFESNEFNKLVPYVDGFSLMTYDYSTAGRSVCVC